MTKSIKLSPNWIQQWWFWLAVIFIVTFISFWPSFFSAIVNVETYIIIHGISAISWMLITVLQAWLINSKWRKYHGPLGYASLALALILVLSGLHVIQTMLLKDHSVDGSHPLLAIKFFYVDITGLILFCAFLFLAIRAARKRDIALHKRLITGTAIIPLEAALERTFAYGTPQLVPNFNIALYASTITLIVIMAVLVGNDLWHKRSRWPFVALLVYYVIMLLTTDFVANAAWFQKLAAWYASL